MKNLRDEFDPVHSNARMGWHKRPLRPNRQRVLGELCDASDEAIIEVVARLLERDKEVEELVTKPMAADRRHTENVAERLRTGRLAEAYFMENSLPICGIEASLLTDCRQHACGYDFGVSSLAALALEIKGLKAMRGQILFTDNEWHEANCRRLNYWLVVVGSVDTLPRATLIKNPAESIKVTSQIRQSATISWRATIAVPS